MVMHKVLGIVNNKFKYSAKILEEDYYAVLKRNSISESYY